VQLRLNTTTTTTTTTMQLITGNTYPVREFIKALGGTWNKAGKGWLVPEDQADAARALVAGAPAAAARKPRRRSNDSDYVSNVYRFAGGAVIYRNKAGRCEDAPCCGCCS
jgi:hypothetical protein